MEDKLYYTWEETKDLFLGEVGTIARDKFEKEVDEALEAYRLGEKIREARKQAGLTQEQLGEKIGVQKSQISKMEKGKSVTLPKLRQIFRALDMPFTLDFGPLGKLAY